MATRNSPANPSSPQLNGAWYYPSFKRLADLGIVKAGENGSFRPSDPLTRLDMAVLLARAFPTISPVTDPSGVFGDVAADAEYAAEVEGLFGAGITNGCVPKPLLYCPDDPVPRDQMASFLARALGKTRNQL